MPITKKEREIRLAWLNTSNLFAVYGLVDGKKKYMGGFETVLDAWAFAKTRTVPAFVGPQ